MFLKKETPQYFEHFIHLGYQILGNPFKILENPNSNRFLELENNLLYKVNAAKLGKNDKLLTFLVSEAFF